jgi:hexosaminidase
MKKISIFLLTLCFSIRLFSQSSKSIAIIPEPVSVKPTDGIFALPKNVVIEAGSQPELKQTIELLRQRLSVPTGSVVTVTNSTPKATISLILNRTTDAAIGQEGYRLSVTPKKITISANEPEGLFYGAQSLVQLFPPEVESAAAVSNVKWEAPTVEILDYPRFEWRGLMFDVSRHFFTKAEVKQFIDQMVRYKFNLLHMHLTDDEGWRIQIKAYPRLTEVGAWNVKKVGYFGTFSPPAPDEPRNFGGFYTQEDIKELVQYAKERFVNILPEIDVPGHSLAAVVSYPELSCTPEASTYHVRSGEEIMDWSKGAPPIALVDNTLCPANEKVYQFLDKVLTEVAALFPFQYIHMGGDECPKNYWEKMPEIKALMEKEKLKNMEEVQSYFEKRLEKIVESKGKKFMGWDEILEGGLAPSAAVMSWRGMKGGIEAAKMGHEVVMSPTDFAYIDYMQSDPIIEPRIYATLRLSKAYQFEPVPEGVDAKFIKGGQANLWTEQIYNMRHQQYMTWPRGWAIAESVWSPKEKKNWDNFFTRVESHFKRYDAAEIKYAPSVYDPIFKATRTADKELQIELTTEVKGLDIYYSFDNSFPDRFYPKYTAPLIPPKDAVMLKVITYKGKQPVGRMIAMPLDELKKRADAKRG